VFALAASNGWPTNDRYTLVFPTLNWLLTRTISSFVGTSPIEATWFTMALNSSSVWDAAVPPAVDTEGAMNGMRPSALSRNLVSSALSLLLAIVVAPAIAWALATVFWAVRPFPLSRYVVSTLSLGSWSPTA
jgi:hypothetical protein